MEVKFLPSSKKSSKPKKKKSQLDRGNNQQLWDALRSMRHELATKQGIPAYMIFSDKTMDDLVESKPQSIDALGDIYGIGGNKQKRYGKAILKVLAEQVG